MKKRVNLSKKIWEFASTWVDVVDALAAHEWGENGQRRPVSKVANKVEPFFFLFFLHFFKIMSRDSFLFLKLKVVM